MRFALFILLYVVLPSFLPSQEDLVDKTTEAQQTEAYEELVPLATQETFTPLFLQAQDESTKTPQEEPIKSPQEVQEHGKRLEEMFKEAEEMFNPWYTGPLLTGSAHMVPPKSFVVQPYIFVTDNYAAWNSERQNVHMPSRVNLNPQVILQTGVTNWLDILVAIQGNVNWQSGKSSGGFGDTSVNLGFLLTNEGLNCPAMKLVYSETFPSGRYQKLNGHKNGLDATGAGSYQSGFGFRISKVVFWSHRHPLNLRASYTYYVPSDVHVRGFNSYGGGHGTRGRVKPGNYSQANAAFEYSFSQRWVFATDAVYVWANKTTFAGKLGTNSDGSPASVGGGSNDQLSLAPAIEYNFNANLGLVGGVWFDVYGRNTPKFVSGIISVCYVFSW